MIWQGACQRVTIHCQFLIFSARKFHASNLPLILLFRMLDDPVAGAGKAPLGGKCDGRDEGVRPRNFRGEADGQGSSRSRAVAPKYFRQPSGRDSVRAVGGIAAFGRRCSLRSRSLAMEWT